jgi:diguanylate cyclase (GGDEF)-like protein
MTGIPERLQDQLRACRTLPSVPAVAMKIIDLCKQEEIGISEVASALARDPALAAKVLKVANSAFYMIRSEVTTLDRAISILGINATLSLSLSFSLVGTLRKTVRTGFNYVTYWRRSVIAAAAAKTLGTADARTSGDAHFLAGLLQDIGMLVLNEVLPDAYGRLVSIANGNHEKLVELERQAFGADHAEVGGWLLDHWKLPDNLKLAVVGSHAPDTSAEPDIGDFSLPVAVAGCVAEIWTNPQTAQATALANEKAKDLLGMSPDSFETLLGKVAASLPGITSDLDLEIGSEEMLNRLLEEAREALVELNLRAQADVRQAQDRASRDGLTSLYNRSYLETALPQYFEVAVRTDHPLSVIFLDIDRFKSVNDTHGHQAGDAVIAAVAKVLRSATRSEDLVARYGGEEFVCILSNTSESGAMHVAERIRTTIATCKHKIGDNIEIAVTVSLGCATFSSSRSFANAFELLQEADRFQYAAKCGGRNKVVASNANASSPSAASSRSRGNR